MIVGYVIMAAGLTIAWRETRGRPAARRSGREPSHPRSQAGEGAVAAQHGLQLSELLVAPVVAAGLDVIGRRGELLRRLVVQGLALCLARPLRLRRAVIDEPIERRERLAVREREPRTLERHVAKKEPHWPRLSDLLDLIEIARGAVPIADAAAEGCASEEAAGELVIVPRGAEAVDGLTEMGAGGARAIVRRCWRLLHTSSRQHQPEVCAAECEAHQSAIK